MEIATKFDLIDDETKQEEGDDKRVNFDYLCKQFVVLKCIVF